MMAEYLDDGEFWLPPKFLSDQDLLMDFAKINQKSNNSERGYEFGNELTRPNSVLSSPGESVVGSTESDEDDYLFGLTRKFAQSTLSDDLWKVEPGFGYQNKWSSTMATSPQSTLCNVMGGGCGCSQGSSRGSPNCTSPPLNDQNETPWGLLYAAAGEVAKMRQINEARSFSNREARKPSPVFVPAKNSNPGLYSNQSMSYQQLQANQIQQLKQQLVMMKQQQGNLRWSQQQMALQNRARNGSNGRPLGLSPSVWPTLQHSQQNPQPGSGMRAVFLGNPGAKRECSGTGVFLPRQAGTATETLKKPACSTVLLPDRVVQALNLNLRAMDASAQLQNRLNSNNASIPSNYDAAMKYRNSVGMAEAEAQQRRNAAGVRPQPMTMNNEVQLPQEWTY